jgi:phosphoribosylamine-glycine ligase
VTAGDYVAVACGLGETVSEACEEAYDLVKCIDIPESINVRDDVGERCKKQIPMLKEFGLMTDWKY